MPFSEMLAAAVRLKRSPLVVGIDPRMGQLPPPLKRADESLRSQAEAVRQFCVSIIEAVAPHAAAVKPQVAFFEELGPSGMAVLRDVIVAAADRGLPVIVDAKRNDIGTTAEAYAHGWLGRTSPWGADALTVSPYLGADSLAPFAEVARQRGAGVFVLVKTSNPGGPLWQDRLTEGESLYQSVAAYVEAMAAATCCECGYGDVGAVVGATYPQQLAELRQAMPHAWLLIPGYGAQGGSAEDVAPGFDPGGLGAVVNSSRGVIFAYERPEYAERFGPDEWTHAVAAAAEQATADLRAHTPAGQL